MTVDERLDVLEELDLLIAEFSNEEIEEESETEEDGDK